MWSKSWGDVYASSRTALTVLFLPMNVRLVDWTHSLLIVCTTKGHIELHSSLFMEHQPQIHLRYMIHLLYQVVLLHLLLRCQEWLNSRRTPSVLINLQVHTNLPVHTNPPSSSSHNNIWWPRQILSVIQHLVHFLQTPLLTHKLIIHLEAQACCKGNVWTSKKCNLVNWNWVCIWKWVKQSGLGRFDPQERGFWHMKVCLGCKSQRVNSTYLIISLYDLRFFWVILKIY